MYLEQVANEHASADGDEEEGVEDHFSVLLIGRQAERVQYSREENGEERLKGAVDSRRNASDCPKTTKVI